MDISSLLPHIEHIGLWGYWVVFLFSFAESLAVVGSLVPGGTVVIFTGFLATQGVFGVIDLMWFASAGAIFGDGLSYYLGSKGTRLFNNQHRLLKASHLERGKWFFAKYGEKSVFLGRFVGIIRSVIPFVAGLSGMHKARFFLWNVLGGVLWAVSHVLIGYFFGGSLHIIETWFSRFGLFIALFLGAMGLLWGMMRYTHPFLRLLQTLLRAIKEIIAESPFGQALLRKYPRFFYFMHARFLPHTFSGMPLTVCVFLFCYVLFLFVGSMDDVLRADAIVLFDERAANLLRAFHDDTLITFFRWITLLGSWQIVTASIWIGVALLFLWQKRIYILPFLITIGGTELFVWITKVLVHRPRPEFALYIEKSFSFPSGHAAVAVALYGFICYFLIRSLRRVRSKINMFAFFLIPIFLIGFSRLYLGVHFVSDVWGGYLVGTLWLIVGITLTELLSLRKFIHEGDVAPLPYAHKQTRIWTTAILILGLCACYFFIGLRYVPQIQQEDLSEKISLVDGEYFRTFSNTIPLYTETISGKTQEPLSFIISAPNDSILFSAFEQSGWTKAQQITLPALLQTAKKAILNEPYPTAPITPSFWNASPHVFGFEKEGPKKSVRERHHIRIWSTNFQTSSGKNIYVATASFDSSMKWLVAHDIYPDIDTEREYIVNDLKRGGMLIYDEKIPFVGKVEGENFAGSTFYTDGEAYIIDIGKSDNSVSTSSQARL